MVKSIYINAFQFFELLKLKDSSMWDIFSQMIDGEPKELIFLDKEDKFLFSYKLPATLEMMKEDKILFAKMAKKYTKKIIQKT